MPAQHMKAPGQAREDTSPAKIDVTSKSPVGDISVVTLIRTDTTLDSQKGREGMSRYGCSSHVHMYALAAHLLSALSPSYPHDLETSLYSEETAFLMLTVGTARKLVASQEILLWMTPSETPKALRYRPQSAVNCLTL